MTVERNKGLEIVKNTLFQKVVKNENKKRVGGVFMIENAFICKKCVTVTFIDPVSTICSVCLNPLIIMAEDKKTSLVKLSRYFRDLASDVSNLEYTISNMEREFERSYE